MGANPENVDIATGILLIFINPVNPVQKFNAMYRAVLVVAVKRPRPAPGGELSIRVKHWARRKKYCAWRFSTPRAQMSGTLSPFLTVCKAIS
jgi:hypothetical protein